MRLLFSFDNRLRKAGDDCVVAIRRSYNGKSAKYGRFGLLDKGFNCRAGRRDSPASKQSEKHGAVFLKRGVKPRLLVTLTLKNQ